ncbi:MAG: hypothetical protein ACRD1H_01145 [Vicinamibacterales bacterium]
MRRRLMSLLIVAIAVCLTASGTLAGMRINRIVFTAVDTTGGGSATISTSSTQTMAKAAGRTAQAGTSEGLCAAPCVGLLLNAGGFLTGLGAVENTVVVIEASGIPIVTCTNQGSNDAPGRNPGRITTSGEQEIGLTQIAKNGSAEIDVTTELPVLTLPGSQLGCRRMEHGPRCAVTLRAARVRLCCVAPEPTIRTGQRPEGRGDPCVVD